MDAGISTTGDGELGSLLGQGFDQAFAEQEVGDTPPGEGGSAPTPPTPSPEPTPPGEGPSGSEPARPQAEAQPAQPAGEQAPYPLSQDGKFYQVPKGDLQGIMDARNFSQAVQEWFPTPQDAQVASIQASTLRQMSNDWVTGEPGSVAQVLQYLSGAFHQDPAMAQRWNQSFQTAVQQMPQMLEQMNPDAFRSFVGASARFDAQGNQLSPASGLLTKAVELAYARAAQSGNPEDFKQAQYLDFGVNGSYKNELPRVDPQAQQMSQFEQRQRDFNMRQEAALKRDSGLFDQTALNGARDKQLTAAIDALLKPVQGKYPETTYTAVRAAIEKEALATLQKSADWWSEHNQEHYALLKDFGTTWQQGAPGQGLQPRVQAYISGFMSRANRVLPAIVQKHLGAATQTRTRAANGQFQQGQPAQPAQTATPATPAQPNGSPHRGRMPADQWNKEWAELFKSA